MRNLLVASQKSGVGKTTTSINLAAGAARAGARILLVETDPLNNISTALNLAQHSQKKTLCESGIDLPGVLSCEVVPGLDVFSPYEEGGCSDDDLDRLLQLLSLEVFRDRYDCLVINAPPFFGGRPGPLLAASDEFLLVMQAEPMAYRTMPAFLEMVHRASQEEKQPAKMHGILLTLPDSETEGGRWERELRGRFGGRVLGQVIPYDAELAKTSLFGQIAVHAIPDSPASLAYERMVSELKLMRDANHPASRPIDATLSLAAAAVQANPLRPRSAPAARKKSSARIPRVRVPVSVGVPSNSPPGRHDDPSVRSIGTPPEPRHAPVRAPEPRYELLEDREPEAPTSPPLHLSQRPWLVWVGLAIVVGTGMRFVPRQAELLPMIVGLAVAAGVILVFLLIKQASEEQRAANAVADPPGPAPGSEPVPSGRKSGPHKRVAARRDY